MKTHSEIRRGDGFPNWRQNATRIEVYGTEGLMYVGRHGGGMQVYGPQGKLETKCPGRNETQLHHDEFFDALRTRKRTNADIEIGHASSVMCHLANIATRLGGARLEYDAATERVTNNEAANQDLLMRRPYRDGYIVPEIV